MSEVEAKQLLKVLVIGFPTLLVQSGIRRRVLRHNGIES